MNIYISSLKKFLVAAAILAIALIGMSISENYSHVGAAANTDTSVAE